MMELLVRKHPAPEGALRQLNARIQVFSWAESESTQHQKAY